MLLWILFFTFIGSIASLIGGVLLLWKKKLVERENLFLIAFAAGAMLSVSFFDLIPEAIGVFGAPGEERKILGTVLFGMVVFFFLERFFLWHHHHACPEGEKCESPTPTIPLLVIGDSLHNFLDGVVIAGAFLVDIPLGIVTALAVGFHEIPQEIGDFGVLLSLGMKKEKVLLVNIFSSLTSFLGAILAFFLLKNFGILLPYLIAFAAGNFIYISASDLIPQLHQSFKKELVFSQTLSFVIGILLILITIRIFE